MLDDGERAAFLKGLTKMIGALQTRGTIPVQRMCVSCAHFRPNVHSDAATPHHCAFVDAAFGDASLRLDCDDHVEADASRSEEHTSELPSLMRISSAVFCLTTNNNHYTPTQQLTHS